MRFRYVATDTLGKRLRGEINADSARDARQLLRERGLVPHQLKPNDRSPRAAQAIRQRDFVLMMRQLATLIGANLPLAQSLLALENQCTARRQKTLLRTLRQRVQEGCSLAEVVAQWPKNFTPLYCAMIAAGEATGKLNVVLEELANYSEKMLDMKRRLLQVMIYPLLLVGVAILVIAILLTTVVPEIVGQFSHMQRQLPLSTRLLMRISEGMQQFGLAILLVMVGAGVACRLALHRRECRQWWHRNQLRIPIVGRVVLDSGLARYIKALSILINSTVPLLEGMAIGMNVVGNSFIHQQLSQAQTRVREGATLTTALDETGLLTPMMRHMIGSGELSGELSTMLKRAADLQEQRLTNNMAIAATALEPLLIITMSGAVLFIIMAILQPILELNNFTG